MNIHLNGFNQQVVTLIAGEEGLEPGTPVAISANEDNTVLGVTSEGAGDFIGICLNCRGGRAAVQLQGYVELETDGVDIGRGWQQLSFDENGKITTGGEHSYLVLNSDTENRNIGFLL